MRFTFGPSLYSCLLLVFLLAACREPKPVSGFLHEAWKNDPGGCKGERAQAWADFKVNRDRLIGYDENDLPFLLGPPDAKDLLEKGQKTYYYYISGSPKCKGEQTATPARLAVRVNVTGKISEVQVVGP